MGAVSRVSDGELCGYVEQRDGQWMALTLFGAALGAYESEERAEAHVLDAGLASLADRWTLRDGATGEEEVVCIAEAKPGVVTVSRGYYSLPGVPALTITEAQLASGEWALIR